MNANKLSLSITPLVTLGLPAMLYFVFSAFCDLYSKLDISICWEAGILAAICYGFILIQTTQMNIHFENIERKYEKK